MSIRMSSGRKEVPAQEQAPVHQHSRRRGGRTRRHRAAVSRPPKGTAGETRATARKSRKRKPGAASVKAAARQQKAGERTNPSSAHRTSRATAYIAAAVRSFRSPPAPRPLPWLVAKRFDARVGDTYGHWWVELDGVESYGWWPARRPVTFATFILGGKGALNGTRRRASRSDPHHGDSGHHQFHPLLVVRKSDWQVRRDIRRFARHFRGDWRWSLRRPSANCRSFQFALFDAVGLAEPADAAATRGRGCAFLHPFRSLRCRRRQRGRRRRVPHRLGGPCGCPPLTVPPVPAGRR